MKRAVVLALIAVGFVYVVVSQLRDKLNDRFSLAIRAESAKFCFKRNPCTVTLEQFLPGDWDRIYVFNPGASQDEITKTIGPDVQRPDVSRLVVFLHGANVLRTVIETPDPEAPDYHLVNFDGVPQQDQHLTLLRRQHYLRTKGDPCDKCVTLKLIPPGTAVE